MLCLTGCELKRMDYNLISSDTFLQNENDAKALVAACYNDIKSGGDGGFWSLAGVSLPTVTEMTTDIMTCNWGDGGTWTAVNELKYTPTVGMPLSAYDFYQRISKYTMDIYRIENIKMDEDLKQRYIAEIKALSGWLSYLLTMHYGTFPIASLEVLLDPTQEKILPRASSQEMSSFIENNLKDAVNILPKTYDDSENGHITKGAALVMLMKFYMSEERWDEAEQIGREIMKLGYKLMPKYEDIFGKDLSNNTEVILSIPCTSDAPNYWLSWSLPYNYETKNTTIAKWSGYRVHWNFYDTFESNDERLKTLVASYETVDGTVFNRENPGGAGDLGVGPIPLKYAEDPSAVGANSSVPIVVYRYADVLLLLAEAINRNVGPTKEAIGFVNDVRNRAGLLPLTADKYANRDAFNDAILLERGHELYCEGHRREDLIRHGKFIEYAKKRPNTLADDYKVLFPIPQKYINEGKGIVLQNPGY